MMNSRSWKQFYVLCALAFTGALALLLRPTSVLGHEDREERERGQLTGTWDVTLRFPECTPTCHCPGGVPNIPIPALQTYFKGESMLEIPGGSFFRGPGVGSWERIHHHEFVARFKFFIFASDGTGGRTGSEEVTSHIDLTGPDSFEAAATFDFFDAAGIMTAQGCRINETATRFE
jgi:hypothetical protein